MRLLVLTPEGTLLHEQALGRVRLTLSDGGQIGIRPDHHPLLAETAPGRVTYGDESYDQFIELQGGILEVDREGVVIYTGGYLEAGQMPGELDSQAIVEGLRAWFVAESQHETGR